MRDREFVAIPITIAVIGLLAIVAWAADAGVGAWIAVGVVGSIAIVVATVVYMRRPHHPSGEAPAARHVEDDVRRVLLIAHDACDPAALGSALGGDGPTSVLVVAPALGSRTARWTGDDHAYQDAQRRVDATVGALVGMGVEARGHIGPHDPLQAADDGLREFPADEIVFAVHPAGSANWLEDGVVATARSRYAIPVREVAVPGSDGG